MKYTNVLALLVLVVLTSSIILHQIVTTYAQWVSPPYGYVVWNITVNLVRIRDRTINYYLNPQNNDGIPADTVENVIMRAANTWSNDEGSTFNYLNYGGRNTTLRIDIYCRLVGGYWRCYQRSDNTQEVNAIVFDDFEENRQSGIIALTIPRNYVTIHSERNFTIEALLEADIVFNDAFRFAVNGSDIDLFTIALHEFGHFGPGLGDVYSVSTHSEDQIQVMYRYTGIKRELRWGDIAGLRWHYPRVYGGYELYPIYTVVGGDVAARDLDGDGRVDLVFVWGEYNSAEDRTSIWARVAWDLNSSSGVPSQVYNFQSICRVSGRVRDVGAAFGDVDRNGVADLVVTFSNATGTYYIVLFDVTATTDHSWSWRARSEVYYVPGSVGDYGTDVVLADLNNNGILDLIVTDSFYSTTVGDYYLWYYIGWDLAINGDASSWTSSGASTMVLTEYVGSAPIQPSNRVYAVGSSRVDNYIVYYVVRFDTTGVINANMTRHGPLYRIPAAQGFGMDSINIGNYQYPDLVLLWNDGTYSYNMIEWESRVDSHP